MCILSSSCAAVSPRIYCACLASYNAGTLHGSWIDADQDAEAIREEIAEMLADSPEPGAEEWAIHDYEGFGELSLHEFEGIDQVAELGRAIAEHGEAFAAYAADIGADHATVEGFEEAYCGEWDSETAYAEDLFDECYAHDIPENLRCYIDYEAFSRDLFIDGYTSSPNPGGGVWVFHRC